MKIEDVFSKLKPVMGRKLAGVYSGHA